MPKQSGGPLHADLECLSSDLSAALSSRARSWCRRSMRLLSGSSQAGALLSMLVDSCSPAELVGPVGCLDPTQIFLDSFRNNMADGNSGGTSTYAVSNQRSIRAQLPCSQPLMKATSKLLYSATMSLDGFIAGPGGDMSWLSDLLLRSDPEIDDLINSIGALLVGKNTFVGDDPNAGTEQEGAYGGQWSGPTIVLTHHPIDEPPDPDVSFVTDLDLAVSQARREADGRYVNVLGANVAKQCLDARMLDEILVLIAPILLGDGVRLFDHSGGNQVRLELIDPDRTGPLTLWYRVAK